jgi:methyl-accepting chemotaxis protein
MSAVSCQDFSSSALPSIRRKNEIVLNRLSVKSTLVLSAYTPLQLPNAKWAIVAEMDLAEVMQPIVWQQRTLLIATVILALVVILVAIVLSNLFVRPVDALVVGAQDITAGKQGVEVQLTSQDEFGRLAQTFNAMVQQLRRQNEHL